MKNVQSLQQIGYLLKLVLSCFLETVLKCLSALCAFSKHKVAPDLESMGSCLLSETDLESPN